MVYLFELLINLALSYIHTSAVGPDLTKFCNFGEIKKSLMIFLVFYKILKLLCTIFIGSTGQILLLKIFDSCMCA